MMIRRKHLLGKQAHLWQRITALYLFVTLPILFLLAINIDWPSDAQGLKAMIGYNWGTFLVWGALIATLIHAWIGGRDMIIDYLPRRLTDLMLTVYFYALIAVCIHLHLLLMI